MATEAHNKLIPMLGVHDAGGANEFYIGAFGAVEVGERYPFEGKIGHAEIRIGDALVMLADEVPPHNTTPVRLGGTPVILHLEVDDVDATADRVVASGAELVRPPEDQPYGRVCRVRDPYGHMWLLNGPTKGI